MRCERIVCHELVGNFLRELAIEATLLIYLRELFALGLGFGRELAPLAREIGLFGVGLGMNRNVFTGRHRHRACHHSRNSRDQNTRSRRFGSSDTEHEAGRRDNPVVRAEHGCAKPAYAITAMTLPMQGRHFSGE